MGKRVLLAGATGTIGRATARALVAAGHEVVAVVRPAAASAAATTLGPGVTLRPGSYDAQTGMAAAFAGERIDAVISCLASRTGAPRDAWAVDHEANQLLLAAAQRAQVPQFVLLSAICVQKPRLAFQHAKLAFERSLAASGLRHAIVRPTAYFKSLSGQVARVKAGKPYLLFGDGTLTACTPISDDDLARYLVECLDDAAKQGVLPIGGPGPALTPLAMGEMLFAMTGRPPRWRSVSPRLLLGIARALDAAGTLLPPLRDKAEFARIGHYYATESMLVWDAARGRYDAEATPQYGTETLRDHYARLLRGDATDDRGAHAVF